MLFHQPTRCFADVISDQLQSVEAHQRKWLTFEFAVAWVNERGVERIIEPTKRFLNGGGSVRATAGLDFGSTSYEGLNSLVALEEQGFDITTHVFHDENPSCTFHPKVFLFSNKREACLIVGSNNLTGAGLASNVEVALGMSAELLDETIQMASRTLSQWRDEEMEQRTRRLTRELLSQLCAEGYVRTEADIRESRQVESGRTATRTAALFGRTVSLRTARVSSAVGEARAAAEPVGVASRDLLLMRVRPRRTGTQLQISMQVHRSTFMRSVEEVVSAIDGTRRPIGYDYTTRDGRKVPNTARFEAPEMAGMKNPVACFRRLALSRPGNPSGMILQYELFDASDGGEGAGIMAKLKSGIGTRPETNLTLLSREITVVSKTDLEIAQWYRLDTD
jgi:HKD family nuclease